MSVSQVAQHFDAILELIASGYTAKDALKSRRFTVGYEPAGPLLQVTLTVDPVR